VVYYVLDSVNDINSADPSKPGFFKRVDGGVLAWVQASLESVFIITIEDCKHHGVTFSSDGVAKYSEVFIAQNLLTSQLNGLFTVTGTNPITLSSAVLNPMQFTISGVLDNVAFEQSQADVVSVEAGSFSFCQQVPHGAWITWTSNQTGIAAIWYNGTFLSSFYVNDFSGNQSFGFPGNVTGVVCIKSLVTSCTTLNFVCINEVPIDNTNFGTSSSGGVSSDISWWEILLIVVGCCVVLMVCVCVCYVGCCRQGSSSSTTIVNH